MTEQPDAILPSRLIAYLCPGAPALMLTTGADGYASSAYTWVVAQDHSRLRFGVDIGSTTLDNLLRCSRVAIQIIGPGDLSFLVKGEACRVKDRIAAAAPAAVMLWEVTAAMVKDQSLPGVGFTALAYEWPAARRAAMLAMEQAVYAEMRDSAA